MKKTVRTVLKLCLLAVGTLLGLGLTAVVGLNLAKDVIYSDYAAVQTDVCKIPGISDGFVCQGICVYNDGEKILVSGYMGDGSPSRIYVTDGQSSYHVSIAYGSGKPFTAHAGGIAIGGELIYVTGGSRLYVIPLASVLGAENGGTVQIKKIIPVNNKASFVSSDGTFVYVGEYHDGGKHLAEHPYETPNGRQYAIVSRYSIESLEAYHKTNDSTPVPNRVYSIRNYAQGISFAPNGQIVISTSYGIEDSVYYVYNEEDAVASEHTLEGAPVYYLYDHVNEIHGPAMAEGITYCNGKLYTLTESAANKYLFGKFFFADRIVALDLLTEQE